jgi:hypothetical protein
VRKSWKDDHEGKIGKDVKGCLLEGTGETEENHKYLSQLIFKPCTQV